MPDILLVGCGKMGSALLRGWGQSGFANITVVDPHDLPADLSRIASRSVHTLADLDGADPTKAIVPDALVIATKPAHVAEVCRAGTFCLRPTTLILSIAAGVSIASLSSTLPSGQPVIRAMPNTPAAIGQGITVAVAGSGVSAAQRDLAAQLLSPTGQLVWIEKESQMDAVTALSGSGPAYVFRLIEVMAQAGIDLGLSPDLAMTLARQTVIGSAALAAQSPDISAADLRAAVTSPGGTTEAALALLNDQESLQTLFTRALHAAAARSRDLGK